MWVSLLKNKNSGKVVQQGVSIFRQSTLMGMFPQAAFVKFDRTKPHLNVGTIGKQYY